MDVTTALTAHTLILQVKDVPSNAKAGAVLCCLALSVVFGSLVAPGGEVVSQVGGYHEFVRVDGIAF